MAEVARRFPTDLDIATLAAEALMNLAPWDYWQAGGAEPKGRTAELVALLERVLAVKPDHPGAIHFYIHAVEASDRPERGAPTPTVSRGRISAAVLVLSVRQSLRSALLAAGEAERAETAFEESLKKAPNNAWALFGLMEAARQRSPRRAAEVEQRLAKAWIGDRAMLTLGRL
jgi:tetratricopeptide (TPR) repeat protein